MKRKIGIIIGLATLLIVAGVMAYQTTLFSEVITRVLDRFQDKSEKGALLASGNVEVTEVDVGFTLSGRIHELLAAEGDRVRKGDLLARLDDAELQIMVTQKRAALNEAQVQLEDLKTGARPQQIEEAKAGVNAAEAQLSKAQKDYERMKALYAQHLIPASQLDSARTAYHAVIAQKKQARERLSLLQEGPTQDAVQAATYRVEQAEAALQAAEERLEDSFITAPTTGVILQQNVEVGEIIVAGTPVYTIGDLAKPWIKVYIKENKLGLVKLGQRVEVTTDSYPNKVYEGRVTYISSEAEFTPKSVQTKEERVKLVFGVKVSMNNPHNELKPGMPADVKIVVNESSG
ncbi:HlyD family efflux transporter periplasmic adaptor subunit [candidate division KSB3 bacterium]|uniref:HlyD family efflux transporter periplasmic adaptor subunit n=1 Tax=candidate division KSB3 bacterium TaxID=2044937 RepID=A0A9D5JWB5_9BACT|nr:HlyD family efflux transporter periplasmic adaptor subunit [candidate division KSB3 bacterium]MBD3325433.1 HlyD family efflux transporter periplasmic adaptor subunit [candidate division KSB3 bacterium]